MLIFISEAVDVCAHQNISQFNLHFQRTIHILSPSLLERGRLGQLIYYIALQLEPVFSLKDISATCRLW